MRHLENIGKRLVNKRERCYPGRKSGNRRGRLWEAKEILSLSRRVPGGIIRGSEEMNGAYLKRVKKWLGQASLEHWIEEYVHEEWLFGGNLSLHEEAAASGLFLPASQYLQAEAVFRR